jgi:hypothetical protein
MKKIIQALLCLLVITSFTGCSSAKDSAVSTSDETIAKVTTETTNNSDGELSNIEKDGYIIYDYSYKDALLLAGSTAESIKNKTTGTQTTYTFVDHVLSCGTYMNGEIVEDNKDNIKTITGSFNVTKNPYDITDLKISITTDTKTDKKTGYIIVNGKQIDINSKFGPIS